MQDNPQGLRLGLKKQLHCAAGSNPATAVISGTQAQTKQDDAEGQDNI